MNLNEFDRLQIGDQLDIGGKTRVVQSVTRYQEKVVEICLDTEQHVSWAAPKGLALIKAATVTVKAPPTEPLFPLGQLGSTPGALALLEECQVTSLTLLARHMFGDWGDLDDHDRKENDLALGKYLRIFSSYNLNGGGLKVWIITEADRSHTTLLLPDEY